MLQGGGGGDEAGHQDDQNLQHHTAPATRNSCSYWGMRNFFALIAAGSRYCCNVLIISLDKLLRDEKPLPFWSN